MTSTKDSRRQRFTVPVHVARPSATPQRSATIPPPLPVQQAFPASPSGDAATLLPPTSAELQSLFVGRMRLLGVLAALIGSVLAVVAVCFFSGALSLPSEIAAEDVRTLMFVASSVSIVYLATCVGAFRQATWTIYTLLVLGYLGLVNSAIEVISGNGMAALVALVNLHLVRIAHAASSLRRQVRQAKAATRDQQPSGGPIVTSKRLP